ncbi:MAG TPA: PAS domain-containing protein [Streptosporangiaceae bacterium]|jgi:PAS domain-containing protein
MGSSLGSAGPGLVQARTFPARLEGRDMLAEELDFDKIFRLHPTAMALVTADMIFVDANDEFLQTTGRNFEALVGHNFFDRFPKKPDKDAAGDPRWIALEEALNTGRRQVDQLIRYDIEDPALPGHFEERYWSAVAVPVPGPGGETQFLELSARDVTPVIMQFRAMEGQLG